MTVGDKLEASANYYLLPPIYTLNISLLILQALTFQLLTERFRGSSKCDFISAVAWWK